jgi:threonine aldolase
MFLSDNATGAHPAILEAVIAANTGLAPGYGADAFTLEATAKLQAIFETDCSVFLTPTGTAANALALAAMTPPWGAIVCHRHAHIAEDEAGAPEFFTGGAKLVLIEGAHCQITADTLAATLSRYSRAWVHGAQPFAVSISNLSESGAAYTVAEIAALGEVCRRHGVTLHMDGARFANALVSGTASPADLTWRAGVDVVSFGATKNGALGVDGVVCFNPDIAKALAHLRKRGGHLLSKHRFLGAQMAAYLRDDLWLQLARAANASAATLRGKLEAAGAEVLHPVDGNEVFVRLDADLESRLRTRGCAFYAWAPDGPGAFRFVTSWATTPDDLALIG